MEYKFLPSYLFYNSKANKATLAPRAYLAAEPVSRIAYSLEALAIQAAIELGAVYELFLVCTYYQVNRENG